MWRFYKLLLAAWRGWDAAQASQQRGGWRLADIALAAMPVFIPVVGEGVLSLDIARTNLHPLEKLIWFGIIWAFPVAGPVLYLLIGETHRRRVWLRRAW